MRPLLQLMSDHLALLLVLAALILASAFAHLALAVLLLLLTSALTGTVATLLAALITTLIILVCHLTLLFTPLSKAAMKRMPRHSVPFVTLNGWPLDLAPYVSYAFPIRSMEDKQAC